MKSGVCYNSEIGECEIWVDGQIVTYAHSSVAHKIYLDMLKTACKHKKTEALHPFRYQDGVAIVCSWCQDEAIKTGRPLAYDPAQASHGLCNIHFEEQMEIVERWVKEQNQSIKVQI